MKTIFKFFEKEGILTVSPIIVGLFFIFLLVSCIIDGAIFSRMENLLELCGYLALLLGLRKTYKAHEKNAMKGILGALLAVMVFVLLHVICENISVFEVGISAAGAGFLFGFFADVAIFVSMIIIATTHFIINTDHHSKPKLILLNQIVSIIAFIGCIINIISCFSMIGYIETGLFSFLVNSSTFYVTTIFVYAAVVCVETKLDLFRIARES